MKRANWRSSGWSDNGAEDKNRRLLRQSVAHGFFRLQHHRMDRTFTGNRPVGWRIVEYRATATYFLAVEQRFVHFNGVDDFQETDFIRRTRWLSPNRQSKPWIPYSTLAVMYAIFESSV
ncbi:hypothetical protein I6G53_06650 [Serratia plymuthica]|nr:hypothetical protein I6G64_19090 [Serratia plymuthica]QPS57201.1 hypothetical protein I6G53_06650 [Serratia plymuthica]QPS61381.1 hypothetical protein I6G52_14885 [Serratia plymuthica]